MTSLPPRSRRWTQRGAGVFSLASVAAMHLFAAYALWRGPTAKLVALAAATYLVRMFAVSGFYHRYFAHRSFKTSRALQLVMAFVGTSATQKGPLWWASTHRTHHKHSDTERDVHSPGRRGLLYAHLGWWAGRKHEELRYGDIPDFAKYPELRWLDRWHWVGVVALVALVSAFGLDAFLWGYAVSTCLLMHATSSINSLGHIVGSRRYATGDGSRNSAPLALLTLGEGWHNNHHHCPSSCRQGFFWYELDLTYLALRALSWAGLVWDIREPPAGVIEGGRGVARG